MANRFSALIVLVVLLSCEAFPQAAVPKAFKNQKVGTDTLTINAAIPIHRLTVNGQGLFYGAFGAINLWQSTSGLGYRFTLNNDTTFRLQRNTTAFSGGTTTTPILIRNNNDIAFSNNTSAVYDTASKGVISDTLKPLTASGTLIIRGGDGHVYQSDDSSSVAVKFLNSVGTPILRIIADSARVGLKGGDDKVATSGQSTGHVNILDPLWVEEDLWSDEGLMQTAATLPGSIVNTTSVGTATAGNKWLRVTSTTGFALGLSFEVGERAGSDYEVHRVAAVSGDTVFTTDKFSYTHTAGTRAATYSYKGIWPTHYNMWRPGGHLFVGIDATRAEVDTFTSQRIEKGRHVMYADQLGKLFGPTIIDGGGVDTTAPASMAVDVDSGIGLINRTSTYGIPESYTFAARTQESVTIAAADNDSNRIDVIYWDSAGVVRVVRGTNNVVPSAPSTPANCLKLAHVTVNANVTKITSNDIDDRRAASVMHPATAARNNLIVTANDYNTDYSTIAQAIDTSAYWWGFSATGKPWWQFKNNVGTVNMFMDTAGNLGINNGSPTQKLTVTGDGLFLGAFQSIRQLQSSTGTGFRWTLNSDASYRLQSTVNGFTGVKNTNIIFDTLGNVGIGSAITFGSSAQKVLALKSSTAPTTGPASTAQVYSNTLGELLTMDSTENIVNLGAIRSGRDAFTTTAQHDTVAITGAATGDNYQLQVYGTTVPGANDNLTVEPTSTGFIAHRAASGTSGLTYIWIRLK